MTKLYTLYIKSHTEQPDFEDEVRASSKKRALAYFLHRTPWLRDWPRETLFNYIIDWDEENKTWEALKTITRIGETI